MLVVRGCSSVFVLVVVLGALRPAEADSEFWAEMVTPGITAYRVLVAAGRERIRAGDCPGALEELGRAAAALPNETEAHLWSGYCLAVLDRHEEALPAWDRAVAADPAAIDDETVAFRMTITLARTGGYRRAAELYERMLARGISEGLRPIVLLNLADMLVAASCEGLEDALEVYEELVREHPDGASGHWGLAAALARAGREEETAASLGTALRLDPRLRSIDGPDVFFVPAFEVHLYRALAAEAAGEADRARQQWQAYLDGGGAEGCWPDLARRRLAAAATGSRR